MYRYKETIFQFLYVEILKKQNLNVDKPKSTLMVEKKTTLNSINLVVFASIMCGCKLYE